MNRLVHLNPIEPSWLSGVTPAGFDCVIDITYRTAADIKFNEDPASTLVLTGRSDNRSTSYLVPATDVVNGKARAFIPGGDLADPNGYDMTLVGTWNGARSVLASGVLRLSSAGVPDLPAVDVIDDVPLLLTRGQTADLTINLWADASKSVGYDITASIVAGTIYDQAGGTVLAPFTVTPIDTDSVRMTLDSTIVDGLPATCWWTLTISAGAGLTTLAQGTVTVQDAP